jgi:peptidoglycan/xylan/chitin deacetylase (PgdA/CDA1 family)
VLSFFQRNRLKKTIKGLLPRSLITSGLPREAGNNVLLTFDDGPHPEITPKVLNLLEKFDVRAIFFIVGRCILKAPYLLKEIQKQGHVIGNHTYIHSNERQPWFLPYLLDLLRCQAEIEKHTGIRPKFFRPAGGQISPTSLLVPHILGMRTVSWSLETDDWQCRTAREAEETAERLICRLRYGDIVILHDDNPHVLKILDILLPVMRSRECNLYSGIDFL